MKSNDTFSVVVLTYNEASNLPACLASLDGLKVDVFVVDSGSSDDTVTIAEAWGAKVIYHPFSNYAQQRNWAQNNLPITTPWVLHMDADHRLTPELKASLAAVFSKSVDAEVNGFLISRRTVFLDRWIRFGGHYPVYHNVLFRKDKGHCEDKLYDQHYKVEGKQVKLKGDMLDVFTESIHTFVEKHNRWAQLEAEDQVSASIQHREGVIKGSLRGNPIQQRRYFKSWYEKLPLFLRPCLYFIIRYFFRLGFLDGKQGLIFHFLQGFWFRFLVDAKIYELKKDSPL